MEKKEDNMVIELLKTLKRLCIIGWLLFFLSQVAWLVAWNLPSEETTSVEQENEQGYNSYIGEDGDINYGETDNHKNDKEKVKREQTTKESETKK